MAFDSHTFLLLFATVLVLHHLPLSWRLKKLNLLVASYVFYAAWNPPFVVLLWISTVIDWVVARAIHRAERRGRRRLLLAVSLAANLGLLGFFKYADFALESCRAALRLAGIEFEPAQLDIVLPVGISFYTFQTLSYTLDIYRGHARPWRSFLDYALYVTFFPQLVAGPIVRATEFLPQCAAPRRATAAQLGWGLMLLTLGLFEKVVVADGLLAPVAEQVYDVDAPFTALAAWCGTVAFAGQIFCDFAGYSTCAIGVALCLGFALPDNFRCPYAAIGFSDFWRRWHISLSTWLRDYVYVPLGGNRDGARRTLGNLMFTMLVGGLWHGASWTFVVWGGLHGLYLIVERVLRRLVPARPLWRSPAGQLGLGLLTFALVCFAWVFFRASDFDRALSITRSMLGLGGEGLLGMPLASIRITTVTISGLLLAHWALRDSSLEQAVARCPWWLRSTLLAGLLVAVVTTPGEDRAFLYFQF